jgi:hypothetical protein
MRWLRNEVSAAALTAGFAPGVLFSTDVDGWLLVGFDYLVGRAASLAPGSPDLPLVGIVTEKISTVDAPGVRPLRDRWSGTNWWNQLASEDPEAVADCDVAEMSHWEAIAPELIDGDRLLHTDLHGEQFVVGPSGSIHVIDWGFPGAGAAWVDTAFLALRLVEAGHSPEQADTWARGLSSFVDVSNEALTAFAVYLAGMWGYWGATESVRGARHRAQLALDYAAWRRSS